MELSRVSYIGDGVTNLFAVTFPYLSKAHVKVFVNGVEDTTFTWNTPTSIVPSSIPVIDSLVVIQRVTPTTPEVDFVDGSNVTEALLDTATRQALFVVEESKDDFEGSLELDTTLDVYDAKDRRISNVGIPEEGQDVITKDYLEDTYLPTIENAVTVSTSQAGIAITKASEANASAIAAKASEDNAESDKIAVEGYLASLLSSAASSLIGFIQAGANTIARTVQDKLRDNPATEDYSTNAAFMGAVKARSTGEQFYDSGAKIIRLVDRVFVGHAATDHAGGLSPDVGTSWLSNSTDGAHYLLPNSTMLVMPEKRCYGIVAAVKTDLEAVAGSAIAFGGIAINDATGVNAVPAWGFIAEIQHETQDEKTWGIEIALKNASGQGTTLNPYSATPTNLTTGLLLAGGGDNAFGLSATHPCTAGIVFGTGNAKGWNSGIVFRSSSIPTGDAIQLPHSYRMAWYDSTGGKSAEITSTNNTPGALVRLNMLANGFNFLNNSGNSAFYIATAPTHVNRIQLNSNVAGAQPIIEAAGIDTNIDLQLIAKGTGNIRFGTYTASSDVAVNGYVTIKDAGGTTRKLATIA